MRCVAVGRPKNRCTSSASVQSVADLCHDLKCTVNVWHSRTRTWPFSVAPVPHLVLLPHGPEGPPRPLGVTASPANCPSGTALQLLCAGQNLPPNGCSNRRAGGHGTCKRRERANRAPERGVSEAQLTDCEVHPAQVRHRRHGSKFRFQGKCCLL